jgi:hypothetical protein
MSKKRGAFVVRIQWVFICLLVTGCANLDKPHNSKTAPTAAGETSPAASAKSLSYSPKAYTAMPFIVHAENKPMKSYVAMNLSYEPYAEIRKSLEKNIGQTLQFRDEAHITVITPPEYDKILKKRIGIQELNSLAEKRSLQASPIKLLCVGKGSASLEGITQSTYYAVVDSESLYSFRKEVQKLYVSRGGRALDFNPELFFAHVTLGFTKRDLHLEDGVTKDATTCILPLREAGH